jgi:hypothetical protein
MIAVPAVFLGLALFLVSIAYRSNRVALSQSPSPDGVVVVADSTDEFLTCTDCHGDLDKVFKQGGVPDLKFTHEMHFSKGVSDCSVCHLPDTHTPDRINKPTMSKCFTCHGVTKVSIVQSTCDTCHPPGIQQKPTTHLTSTWLPDGHAKDALKDQFLCMTCHKPTFCTACHGLTMPHPDGWAEEPHTAAFFDSPGVCQQCHRRAPDAYDFCDTCHHPQGPKGTPWREYHRNVVIDEGAFTCFQCHSETTCSSCHVRHEESFEADRELIAASPAPSPAPSSSPTGG